MERQSIFDKLNHDYDLFAECKKIESKLCETRGWLMYFLTGGAKQYKKSIYQFVDTYCFTDWKYRRTYFDISEMRKSLEILDFPNNTDTANEKIALTYLEFVLNIITLALNQSDLIEDQDLSILYIINENISKVLDSKNYIIYNLDEKHTKLIITDKSTQITAALELVSNEDIRHDIMQYTHRDLNNDLAGKRKLLSQIYKVFEEVRNDIKDKVKINKNHILEKDLGSLFNNTDVRHAKPININIYNNFMALSPDEKEAWYDRIFDMVITAIQTKKYIDMKDDLDNIKSNGQET